MSQVHVRYSEAQKQYGKNGWCVDVYKKNGKYWGASFFPNEAEARKGARSVRRRIKKYGRP